MNHKRAHADFGSLLRKLTKQPFAAQIPDFKQLRNHPMLDSQFYDLAQAVVYVLDLRDFSFVYASENTQDVLGFGAEVFMRQGFGHCNAQMHPDDFYELNILLPQLTERFWSIPQAQRLRFKLTMLFRSLQPRTGDYRWILQQNMALYNDEDGNLVYVLGVMTDITALRQQHHFSMVLSYKNSNGTYEMDPILREHENPHVLVTSREREIIQLLARGLNSKQIAEAMHISTHTVNTHRKNILGKTGTHNVIELVSYATSTGLL